MARISNRHSLISVDPRFVNQIPAAWSYSGFNLGDGDIFLRSLPEVHQDVTTLPWNSRALVKYFSNLNLSATIPGNFPVNERNPVTQTGDKILPVMTEHVIENHTSFYPDIPLLEMHFRKDSVTKSNRSFLGEMSTDHSFESLKAICRSFLIYDFFLDVCCIGIRISIRISIRFGNTKRAR